MLRFPLRSIFRAMLRAPTTPRRGAAPPPAPPGTWILAANVWNDAGSWTDSDVWKD